MEITEGTGETTETQRNGAAEGRHLVTVRFDGLAGEAGRLALRDARRTAAFSVPPYLRASAA
jgi:hypothetical protein